MWTDFVNEVFVVNLLERKDRWMKVNEHLRKLQINFRTWFAIKDSDGRKGLIRTMISLFEHCVTAGYSRACVFEDDIKILRPNFNEIMELCVQQLPKDFHLFYLGGNVWEKPVRKDRNILKTPAIYSSHAIIYNKPAIEYILHELSKDKYKEYDVLLVKTIQSLNNCYCAYPLLISQQNGYSDIMGKEINYEKFIEARYHEKTKGL